MKQPEQVSDKRVNGFLFFSVLAVLFYYLQSIGSGPYTLFHSDPLNGFLALKNWEAGGAFNYLESVRATDISFTNREFLTWWSPAQYLIPFALRSLLHLGFIESVKATVMLGLLIFIPGVIYLFRYFGFRLKISLICILIFLLQRMFFINTWGYDGGDILFISFLPWYLFWLMKALGLKNPLLQFIIVLLLTLFSIFLKLTFIVVALSVLFYLLLSLFSSEKALGGHFSSLFSKNRIAPALGIVCALGLVYLVFLSHGSNPNHFNGMHFRLKDSIELFLMPLSIFSFTGLTTFLLGKSLLMAITFYFILFLAIFLICKMVLASPNEKYRRLIISFTVVFFFYFFYSFNFANVSGGDRHVRLVSFLCLPLIIQALASRRKNISFYLISGLLFIGTAYSVFSVYKFKKQTDASPVVGLRGFDYHTQIGVSLNREMLDTLIHIDSENKHAIFLTDNFHWALDMQHSRYGMLGTDFLEFGFSVPPPAGSNLYILINESLYNGSAFSRDSGNHFRKRFASGENILLEWAKN